MIDVSTDLLYRLKKNDSAAWFELWDVFGPSIERMVGSIASRYFSQETIKDVSQETLSRLYREIGKFDTTRGVKFSTWLYSIARHVVLTELTHRSAKKRNEGHKPMSLDLEEGMDVPSDDPPADVEASIFRAKVLKAMRNVEGRVEVLEFEAYRMKVLDRLNGKDIATQLGISEASVSRYLKRTRDALRAEIGVAVAAYSWTADEEGEAQSAGLDRAGEEDFDDALEAVLIEASNERKNYASLSKTAAAAAPKAALKGRK